MNNVIFELNKFQEICGNLTIEEIFKKIGDFDKKYVNNLNYWVYIDGIIVNIGQLKKSADLISYSIKRLKQKLIDEKTTDVLLNKFHYDLGVAVTDMGELKLVYPFTIESLIDNDCFREASMYYAKIPISSTSYPSTITNLSNILDKYGRNYESILLYDKVLEKYPNFGMALCNKAQAIVYYYKLTQTNPELLLTVIELLEKSLIQENTVQNGGPNIIKLMETELEKLRVHVNKKAIKKILESIKEIIPKSEELQFYKKNKLFLNLCFGCKLCEQGYRDTLYPKYIVNTNKIHEEEMNRYNGYPKKIYFSFKILNQIYEDYSIARKLLWLYKNGDFIDNDILTNYIYSLDYIKNSTSYGFLKTSFAKLYNILDKIAYLIFYYFEKEKEIVYFSDIHCDEIKNEVIKSGNYQFLALYSLSNDFNEGGIYNNLRILRNKITHGYLNLTENPNDSSQIKENEFYEDTLNIFSIVKAALVYFVIAVKFVGKQYNKDRNILHKQIYFQKDF